MQENGHPDDDSQSSDQLTSTDLTMTPNGAIPGQLSSSHVDGDGVKLTKRRNDNPYSRALCNDNIVIVETTFPVTSSASTVPNGHGKPSRKGSGDNTRAGATLRGLLDAELPQPDTVRRAKDMFETLAKKQCELAAKMLSPSRKSTTIGRSQSMLVLTGRAWCNGVHLTSGNQRNTTCGTAISGTRAVLHMDDKDGGRKVVTLARSNTLPSAHRRYQRSCSHLDKFFHDQASDSGLSDSDTDDDDDIAHYDRNGTGSPVSPEVIRKIREKGTCVTFFGGQARVEEVPSSDEDDDDISDCSYLLDYPYDLYQSPCPSSPSLNGYTSSLERHKPKIVNVMPKTLIEGSVPSSPESSMQDGSENPSPAPTTLSDRGSGSPSWYLNVDDLKTSLGTRDVAIMRSGSSCSSGYIRLKYRYTSMQNGSPNGVIGGLIPQQRCHGKWLKNPYWNGSYYVIYDFTIKPDDGDDDTAMTDTSDNDGNLVPPVY